MQFWLNDHVNNYSDSTEKTLHLTAEKLRANGVEVQIMNKTYPVMFENSITANKAMGMVDFCQS